MPSRVRFGAATAAQLVRRDAARMDGTPVSRDGAAVVRTVRLRHRLATAAGGEVRSARPGRGHGLARRADPAASGGPEGDGRPPWLHSGRNGCPGDGLRAAGRIPGRPAARVGPGRVASLAGRHVGRDRHDPGRRRRDRGAARDRLRERTRACPPRRPAGFVPRGGGRHPVPRDRLRAPRAHREPEPPLLGQRHGQARARLRRHHRAHEPRRARALRRAAARLSRPLRRSRRPCVDGDRRSAHRAGPPRLPIPEPASSARSGSSTRTSPATRSPSRSRSPAVRWPACRWSRGCPGWCTRAWPTSTRTTGACRRRSGWAGAPLDSRPGTRSAAHDHGGGESNGREGAVAVARDPARDARRRDREDCPGDRGRLPAERRRVVRLVRGRDPRAGPGLPKSTSYNGLDAPFAYPPLAFLATAGLESILPIGTVEWLRWIPLAASIATIPAFFLLALELAPSASTRRRRLRVRVRPAQLRVDGHGRRPHSRPGICARASSPSSSACASSGEAGGAWLGAGVCLGLTVLTHPQAGLFAAVSLALVTLAFARSRPAWWRMIAAAAVAVLLAAPWLLLVVARYGPEPPFSAGGTSLNLVQSALLPRHRKARPTSRSGSSPPAWRPRRGLLARRRDAPSSRPGRPSSSSPTRGPPQPYVSVPLSLLAAVGLLDVVVARLGRVEGDLVGAPDWPTPLLRRRSVRAVVALALAFAMMSASLAPYVLSPMATLSADARSAMAWSRDALPTSARVVVVTGRSWYEDATSEWFPYLADRVSVATVQGYEWMGLRRAGSASWSCPPPCATSRTTPCRRSSHGQRSAAWSTTIVYVPKGPLGGVPLRSRLLPRDADHAPGSRAPTRSSTTTSARRSSAPRELTSLR